MIGVILIGFAAGMLAGLLGIGGGALFVPALALIVGLSQVDAQATSLLAIVPVSLVGAWRQHRYGNMRLGDGVRIGLFAIPAALLGVVIVNAIPERITKLLFAALLVYIAWTLARGALQELRAVDGRTLGDGDDDDATRPA